MKAASGPGQHRNNDDRVCNMWTPPLRRSLTSCQRAHPCIKLLRSEKPEVESGLVQTDVLLVCGQRDLCRLLISNVQIEAG
jgi:hypothetical protein